MANGRIFLAPEALLESAYRGFTGFGIAWEMAPGPDRPAQLSGQRLDEAATKLLFLVLNRAEKERIMPPREWAMAKSQFAVLFGERFTMAMD